MLITDNEHDLIAKQIQFKRQMRWRKTVTVSGLGGHFKCPFEKQKILRKKCSPFPIPNSILRFAFVLLFFV